MVSDIKYHRHCSLLKTNSMNRENQPLVTCEPIEFEKYAVEIQDLKKITDCFKRIYRIYLVLTTKNRKSQHVINWTWTH